MADSLQPPIDDHRLSPEGGEWVTTWACDAAPCDLLRIRDVLCQVITRDYPPTAESTFTISLPDKSTITLNKLDRVEIYDPNGSVKARIKMAPDWRPTP